jgi:DNA-binding XRE family transcriptional regulator
MNITSQQCRAARAWLDWKQEELARAAGVSLSTVRDFEKGRRKPIANNCRAIAEVFAQQGISMNFHLDGRAKGMSVD